MKKLVMMLVCMFAVHTMVMADNDKPIEVSQLPAKAQTFIKTYFKDHKAVSYTHLTLPTNREV